MSKSKPFHYIALFRGRMHGALGVCYAISHTINSDIAMSEEDILAELYGSFECITDFHISKISKDTPVCRS